MDDILKNREVIFEMTQMGAYIRVMAMDTATMTEVVIQAPAGTSEAILQRNAIKRLAYVLRKKGLIA